MTNSCTIHGEAMTERKSKTKFNQDGSPKTYWAHNTADGLCFGEGMGKAVRNGRADQTTSSYPSPTTPYVDPEARGKSRCVLMAAVIQKDGLEWALDHQSSIERAVSIVMNGPEKAVEPQEEEEEPSF